MKGSKAVASPALVHVASPARAAPVDEPLDLAALYTAHAPAIARWAARLGGPGTDVEDAVHDVFLVVEKKRASFRGASSIATWLYGITANVVRHQRRKRRVLGWLRLDDTREVFDLPSLARTPLEALEARDASRLVYAILDHLSEPLRTVLILHELEGLSGPEIAALEGVKPSTVWVRLFRARTAFLAELTREQEKSR
ncbi:sigma-70 family RNA polymerase sigma factor [Myxococcota bacterium]|nr:sigma-70 family RNA polymerase sigma factor [Myxococcota bacterium]